MPSASRHLPVEVLRRYVAGELGPAEQHQVETHTLDCAQCADILEGLEMQPAAATEVSLLDLRQRVCARVAELAAENEPAAAPIWAWRQLAAAAVLLLTLGAVAWFTLLRSGSREVASRPAAIERLAVRAPRLLPESVQAPKAAPAVQAPTDAVAQVASATRPKQVLRRRHVGHPQYARVAPKAPYGADVPLKKEQASIQVAMAQANAASADTAVAVKPTATDAQQGYATQSSPEAAAQSRMAPAAFRASGLPDKEMSVTTTSPTDSAGWRTVRGRITDQATGQAVPGATVLVLGTQLGASSAADGSFEVKVPATAQQLAISSIGYTTQTKALTAADTTLVLALAADNKQLSEVVVVRRDAPPTPMSVSAMPAGGYGSLKKYLKDSLDYPEKALETHTEGTVKLRFTVGEDGKISDIKVVKQLTDECDAEAIRLIQEGPAWFPAISKGRRTARQVEISVPFKIEGR